MDSRHPACLLCSPGLALTRSCAHVLSWCHLFDSQPTSYLLPQHGALVQLTRCPAQLTSHCSNGTEAREQISPPPANYYALDKTQRCMKSPMIGQV